jgi:hypothetical protein
MFANQSLKMAVIPMPISHQPFLVTQTHLTAGRCYLPASPQSQKAEPQAAPPKFCQSALLTAQQATTI